MKIRSKKILSLILIIILCSMIFYSKFISSKPAIRETFMMGTFVQLKVYGPNAKKAIQESVDRISKIEDEMSLNVENSEVVKINRNAGVASQKVSNDTYFVIKKALEYSNISQGDFDITVEPLVKLWGIGSDKARVPSGKEIQNAISYINYNDVILGDNSEVFLKRNGMAIDLGGIAKGYAADEIKKIFEKNNVKKAFINLGGNVYVMGDNINGDDWNIGIQNPLGSKGEYLGILKVKDKSVVTSGNYERYFIKDGKRYHHIFNPTTGYPAENGLISTTIVSDKSIDGDALSTATYVLGLEKSLNIIESIKGVDAVFVTNDKKVYTTSGLKEVFQLKDKGFNYEKGR